MKGRHEKGIKLSGAAKGAKKNTFANVVVTVCVVVALLVTLATVWEYHRLNTAISSGVLTAIFGMWGGELLIVALRQIFGSDVIGKKPPDGDGTDKTDTNKNNSNIFGGI